MTVPAILSYETLPGTNTVNGAYAFAFKILYNTDLVVTTTTGGVPTTLLYPSQYSVAVATAPGTWGGVITIFASVPSTTTVTISRIVPIAQPYDSSEWPFHDRNIARIYDYTVMLIQQVNDQVGSSPVMATGTTSARSISSRFADTINAKDFGAINTGAVDNAVAFMALSTFVNAISNTNGDPVTVIFPRGEYLFSNGLSFTRPVILFGYGDATLVYSGTGIAITMGPVGLTNLTYLPHQNYGVQGLTFSGGSSMVNGIYFQDYITVPRIRDCRFYNFGNSTSWGIYFQRNNWDSEVSRCSWYTAAAGPSSNWIQVSGYLAGVSDNGQSRLRVERCLSSHQAASGIGIWLNGANSTITSGSKIEGFMPNVRFGAWANYCVVSNSYFEVVAASGTCFEYGDLSTGPLPNNFLNAITIRDSFVNVHNTDLITSNYVMAPTAGNVNTGLQSLIFNCNYISNLSTTREAVNQTSQAGQNANSASDNRGVTLMHTGGVVAWSGDQGESPGFKSLTASDMFLTLQSSGNSNQGITINNTAGTTYTQWYMLNSGVSIYNCTGSETFRTATTGLAQFSQLGIRAQKTASAAQIGEIFENSADGFLYYKNLAGSVDKLSN